MGQRLTRLIMAGGLGLAGAGALAAVPAAGRVAAVRPALGDWEGTGPHGLRMSFELARQGRRVIARNVVLGLPNSCRASGQPGWIAESTPGLRYSPPGTATSVTRRDRTTFVLSTPVTHAEPVPAEYIGHFGTARSGDLDVQVAEFRCAHGQGWPATVHYVLHPGRRPALADGLYTGPLTAPFVTGTATMRVTAGGRVETDFRAEYSCATPTGSTGTTDFEVGPLPRDGQFIAPDGTVSQTVRSETRTTDAGTTTAVTTWHAVLHRGGTATGGFQRVADDPDTCGAAVLHPTFTLHRTGS